MALEIYSGQGNANSLIDKMISMWDFDSSDTVSVDHSATYGNVVLAKSSNYLYIKTKAGTDAISVFMSDIQLWKIIKAKNSIMACVDYNGKFFTVVLGVLSSSEGTSGKGAFGHESGSTNINSIMGESKQGVINQTPLKSDAQVQLVEMAAPSYGDWHFVNGYRFLISEIAADTLNATQGKRNLNGDIYYISGNAAIKEE